MATAIHFSKVASSVYSGHLGVGHRAQVSWKLDSVKSKGLIRAPALKSFGSRPVSPNGPLVSWSPPLHAPRFAPSRRLLVSPESGSPGPPGNARCLSRSPSVPTPRMLQAQSSLKSANTGTPLSMKRTIQRTMSGALSLASVEACLERAPSSNISMLEQLLNEPETEPEEGRKLERRHSALPLGSTAGKQLAPWDGEGLSSTQEEDGAVLGMLRQELATQRKKELQWQPSMRTHPEMQEGDELHYYADAPRPRAQSKPSVDLEHGHFDPLGLGSPETVLLPQALVNKLHIPETDKGIPGQVQDMYQGLLKQSWPAFLGSLLAAPAALSAVFTAFYLLDIQGLAMDDSIMQSASASCEFAAMGAQAFGADKVQGLNFFSFFEAFMMSLGMSTGVDPVVHAVSPYTMIVAQLNGMSSQLMFVLLSGAVFARFSSPAEPIACSKKAVIMTLPTKPRQRMLALRYAVQQELVDVKVDVTVTRTIKSDGAGGWMRTEQPLKLVRSGAAYQTEGMVVQHMIDPSSPLYGLNQAGLREQDVKLTFSVVGLERASMQSIVHIEEYSAKEGTLMAIS